MPVVANEVIIFGDSEAAAIVWLNPRLTPVKVSTQIPSTRPDELVRVSRTGGVRRDLITDQAQLTFECWAKTGVRASAICSLIRAHMSAAEGETINGLWIYKVTEVGGPVNFPDPESTSPRYQLTLAVASRYAALGA